MTPTELEAEITRVKWAADDAYIQDDYATARRFYAIMAELVSQRSDEVVAEMEKRMGLR